LSARIALNLIDRVKISLISTIGYWIIRFIGFTMRWEAINYEKLESMRAVRQNFIMAFWHGRIFMATYYFRNQGIVVMTSRNRDGEYIARVIKRFGYGAARGSSTRGSHGAAGAILRTLERGNDVGFTMDGPRGPRYVAKRGAAFIARKSGRPVLPFSVSAEKKWVVKSWDLFQIPKPFSRAVVLIGDPIYIDASASEQEMRIVENEIQQSLDELRDRGDNWWSESGKDK
jgi:lysophospholipid acyltransferase (LPLAT)-like uncharacterized protein